MSYTPPSALSTMVTQSIALCVGVLFLIFSEDLSIRIDLECPRCNRHMVTREEFRLHLEECLRQSAETVRRRREQLARAEANLARIMEELEEVERQARMVAILALIAQRNEQSKKSEEKR